MRDQSKRRNDAWIDWTGFTVASLLGAIAAISLMNALIG